MELEEKIAEQVEQAPAQGALGLPVITEGQSAGVVGNPVGYFVSEFVSKVEKSLVKSPDDPFYKVSSSIAGRVSNDRTLGSIIAFGVYYVLNEAAGRK